MNIERLKLLRNDVANRTAYADRPATFRMDQWMVSTGDDCGTAGCLAGYCIMRANEDVPDEYSHWAASVSQYVRPWPLVLGCKYLEIDLTDQAQYEVAERLFTPEFTLQGPQEIGHEVTDFSNTPGGREFIRQCALKTLDRLIETGVCDWREVYERFPHWQGNAAPAAPLIAVESLP